MRKLIIFLIAFKLIDVNAQDHSIFKKYEADQLCISAEAMELFDLVNVYRKKNKLPPIPLSKALCHVAQVHAEDMEYNMEKLTHAWSTCRYNSNIRSTYDCMWNKPKELTSYEGIGFECAHGGEGNYKASAKSALSGWQSSRPHNNVILNKSIWKDYTWNAIGIGISGGYATLWFGKEEDLDGSPKTCK